MESEILVIDKALPEDIFSQMKGIVYEDYENFPWYVVPFTAYNDSIAKDKQQPASFAHMIIDEGRDNSGLAELTRKGFKSIIDNYTNYKEVEIYRARLGMIMPKDNYHVHDAHVDYPWKHKTALIYIHASDGPTYFWDCKYPICNGEVDFVDYFNENNKGLWEKIPPKDNRMVLFDGEIYHSSSTPSKERRIALNINFVVKE